MGGTLKKATLEDAWGVIRELGEVQKKTEESLQETQREVQKTQREVQKTQKEVRELNDSLKEANGNFNNKWGQFLENLLAGDLVKLLRKRKIKASKIVQRTKIERGDKSTETEYDILAENDQTITLVEMKTTLKFKDVDKLLWKLKNFKRINPKHKEKTLYGGMAYLGLADDSIKHYIQKQGLLLIQSPGGDTDISIIVNDEDFIPKEF